MKEFETSLIREKFIIHDPTKTPDGKKHYTVALSNRMVVELSTKKTEPPEIYVVRTQNMHSCVRMCAKILQSYKLGGSLSKRPKPYNWAAAWNATVNDYEKTYNEDLWAAIYKDGRSIYKTGTIHPLLDLIEKCDESNHGSYDDSFLLAEDALKKTGQVIKIEYDGNVALVSNFTSDHARCGVILRGAHRNTTFNFNIALKDKNDAINVPQCLAVAAAFLEGLQLSFTMGMYQAKKQLGLMDEAPQDNTKIREVRKRLSLLSAEIANLENSYVVSYRPERPEFDKIIAQTVELTAQDMKKKKP